MADTFKFPSGGYDVTVLKKDDVIKSINDNIIDKDIALAIVEQCEIDAANFLKTGRWTGIPFIGNIRIPKNRLMQESDEQQALIREAAEGLESHKYILFRKQLNAENAKQIKHQRLYRYLTSIAINNNKSLYKRLVLTKGEIYARIFLYTFKSFSLTIEEEFELDVL